MKYVILGLGNPGDEYDGTRHNAGRMAAHFFAATQNAPEFSHDKKSNALITKNKLGKHEIITVLPETFMNKSGSTVVKFIRPKKMLKELIVLHDDLDLPLGKIKISFGKNSGGHKGVESVMRALKNKNFYRVRIGVCPQKKPGHKELMKFIVGKFGPIEKISFNKTLKKIAEALEVGITTSMDRAMSEFN